jgi:hypothetical protein
MYFEASPPRRPDFGRFDGAGLRAALASVANIHDSHGWGDESAQAARLTYLNSITLFFSLPFSRRRPAATQESALHAQSRAMGACLMAHKVSLTNEPRGSWSRFERGTTPHLFGAHTKSLELYFATTPNTLAKLVHRRSTLVECRMLGA